jgi:diacylglycerol kinase (ATP)
MLQRIELAKTDQTRSWGAKLHDALRGINFARGNKSFAVHQLAAVVVIAAGVWLQVDLTEWCLLIICIAAVTAAETFNGSIESLAKFAAKERDPLIGRSLDMAAGAILLTAIGAACVGLVIFVPKIAALFADIEFSATSL